MAKRMWCPDCGKMVNAVKVEYIDGTDEYNWTWVCPNCGEGVEEP